MQHARKSKRGTHRNDRRFRGYGQDVIDAVDEIVNVRNLVTAKQLALAVECNPAQISKMVGERQVPGAGFLIAAIKHLTNEPAKAHLLALFANEARHGEGTAEDVEPNTSPSRLLVEVAQDVLGLVDMLTYDDQPAAAGSPWRGQPPPREAILLIQRKLSQAERVIHRRTGG